MRQSRLRNFVTGALIGVGLGVLFAPREGSETREKLKTSFDDLIDTVNDIDVEETKNMILAKIDEIKKELSKVKVSDAKKVLEEKKEMIAHKCDTIIDETASSAIPVVVDATKKVKAKTEKIFDEVIEDLEVRELAESVKKKTSAKKKTTSKTKTTTKKSAPKKRKVTRKSSTSKKKSWFKIMIFIFF